MKLFWKHLWKDIYNYILFVIFGFVICSIRYCFRMNSLIHQHSEEAYCNISNRNVLDGHTTLDNDSIIDKMDVTALFTTFKKYLEDKQWKCCFIETYSQTNGINNAFCMDEVNKVGEKCLAYTFGVNPGFEFETAFWKAYICGMYLFDYRIDATDTEVPGYVSFFSWGLTGRAIKHDNMKTLSEIRNNLSHTCTSVNLLKLNQGAWELDTLALIVESGELELVKQLFLEIQILNIIDAECDKHHTKLVQAINVMKTQLNILRKLYEQGFRIFGVNPMNFHLNCSSVISISMINSKRFGKL